MWQRFSENARKSVFFAQEEAQRLGAGYVSTEHMLLGLLREEDNTACRMLRHINVPPRRVKERLLSHLPPYDPAPSVDMTLTPRAKRAIDLAYDAARGLQHDYIGTEHLLLGVLIENDGFAAKVLTEVGATESVLVRALYAQAGDVARGESVTQAKGLGMDSAPPRQNWVEPVVLDGKTVRLEPLSVRHARDLAEACDPEMFQYFPVYPQSFDTMGLNDYIELRVGTPLTVAYAIVLRETGKAIGSSSFFDIRPNDRGLEVGHTWIMKGHRGTKVNPETKLLMLGHAFEKLGALRVQLKTDMRNVQSQRAMLKMGAKQEGVLRKNMVMPDGYVRDSVFFSVIAEEWPGVKEGLIARLKTDS